ncbi:MAG: hypothetical protein H6835_06715 [Planctomycetes bacterium]|nr:hypothetical protein [Planctomycetota bacterium]
MHGARVETIGNSDCVIAVETLSGCVARWCSRGPFVPKHSTTTDDTGYFALQDAPHGVVGLRLEHPDFAPFTVPVHGARFDCSRLRLHRGAAVTGRFALPSGFDYCQVVIGPRQATVPAGFCAGTNTDAEGRFTLAERVPPGDYLLWFTAPDRWETFDAMLAAPQWCVPLHVAATENALHIDTGPTAAHAVAR